MRAAKCLAEARSELDNLLGEKLVAIADEVTRPRIHSGRCL